MRLIGFRDAAGQPAVGVVRGSTVVPLSALAAARLLEADLARLDLGALLAADPGLAAVREALRRIPAGGLDGALPLDDVAARPTAAIPRPGKVVCIGLNYRDHVAEQGGELPDRPLLFAKFSNAVIADGEAIVRPAGTRALDLEAELGVVIGRRARRVGAADAWGHVAGYVALNDVSARDWQGNKVALAPGERGDGQWLRAKGSDTFLPMGATFVTLDELGPDPGAISLAVRSWRIPGTGPDAGRAIPMQDGQTRDLVFDVPALVAFVSASITLEPGDVISTGTPAGVGVFHQPPVYLEPGDTAQVEIEGVGTIRNRVVDAGDDPRGEA